MAKKFKIYTLIATAFFATLTSFCFRWLFIYYLNIDILDAFNNPGTSVTVFFIINCLRLLFKQVCEDYFQFNYHVIGLNNMPTPNRSITKLSNPTVSKMDIRDLLNERDVTPGRDISNSNRNTNSNHNLNQTGRTNHWNSNNTTNPEMVGVNRTSHNVNVPPYTVQGEIYVIHDPLNIARRGFFNPFTREPYPFDHTFMANIKHALQDDWETRVYYTKRKPIPWHKFDDNTRQFLTDYFAHVYPRWRLTGQLYNSKNVREGLLIPYI